MAAIRLLKKDGTKCIWRCEGSDSDMVKELLLRGQSVPKQIEPDKIDKAFLWKRLIQNTREASRTPNSANHPGRLVNSK